MYRHAFRRYRRSRSGMIALGVLSIMVVLAVAGDSLSPHEYKTHHLKIRFHPPSLKYPMGTDEFGQDIMSRIFFGSRYSLGLCALSVTLSLVAGSVLGLFSGYMGRHTDAIVMRIMDIILSFPAILLAMVMSALIGRGISNVMWAIFIINIPTFARIVRANVLSQKEKEYVEAASAVGAGNLYIMFRTIFPNCIPALMVQVTVSLAFAILLESALSFLGLGIQPPTPSWGSMLNTGRRYMRYGWWMGVFPGIFITALVLSLNMIADSLQEALDPTRRTVKR
jgi:peptide/nickel transport system permease protein